jgi:hypothetical protein
MAGGGGGGTSTTNHTISTTRHYSRPQPQQQQPPYQSSLPSTQQPQAQSQAVTVTGLSSPSPQSRRVTQAQAASPGVMSFTQSLTSFGGSQDDDEADEGGTDTRNTNTNNHEAPFQVSRTFRHSRLTGGDDNNNNNNNHNNDADTQSEYTYDESATTEVQSSVFPNDNDDEEYNDDDDYDDDSRYNANEEQNTTVPLNDDSIHLDYIPDATRQVHHVHYQLLKLLSNPESFAEVLKHGNNNKGTVTGSGSSNHSHPAAAPENEDDDLSATDFLPHFVFAPDAEVVLPQALTASQLFGMERTDGIELKSAVGLTAICQLFLRWLALMPGGDHENIICPPGLTIMRIAGGRYRVTAAHRCVWKWRNSFLPDPLVVGTHDAQYQQVQFGDLVSMTIVDVFETDLDGKLLSYCPTFDNRMVVKTHATLEGMRKGSHRVRSTMGAVRQSTVGRTVERATHVATSTLMKYAEQATMSMVEKMTPAHLRQPSQPQGQGHDGGPHGGGGGTNSYGRGAATARGSTGTSPFSNRHHKNKNNNHTNSSTTGNHSGSGSHLSLPSTGTNATSTMKDALAMANVSVKNPRPRSGGGGSPTSVATAALTPPNKSNNNKSNNPYYMSDDDTTAVTRDTSATHYSLSLSSSSPRTSTV